MAVYPGAPTLTNPAGTDNVAGSHAALHSAENDEIAAIASDLTAGGLAAKGPYATSVRNRFEILDWKRSCRVGSTANIAGTYATGPPATKAVGGTTLTVDGVALANGDRVFLKDQTATLENGIYQVSGIGTAVVLTRTYDGDDSAKMSDNMYVSVEQGATNSDSTWELQTNNPITLGTTGLLFTRVHPAYTTQQVSVPAALGPFNPTGAILENMPRQTCPFATTLALTSGTVRIFPLGTLRAGVVASAIHFFWGTTTATQTAAWAGICDVNRTVRGVSASKGATSPGTNLDWAFTFGSAYTPTVDAHLWGFIMVLATTPNGPTGNTNPPSANVWNAPMTNVSTTPILGNSNTGQTASPPAVGSTFSTAITAVASGLPYAYLT